MWKLVFFKLLYVALCLKEIFMDSFQKQSKTKKEKQIIWILFYYTSTKHLLIALVSQGQGQYFHNSLVNISIGKQRSKQTNKQTSKLASKAKQSKAKQSKAKQSKAKQSKAKQSKAKQSKAKQTKKQRNKQTIRRKISKNKEICEC